MKSPGTQITDILIERPERRRFEITLDRKAAGPILTYPPTAETVGRVIPGPVVPRRLRSLIPSGATSGSAILYVRETSFTNSPIAPTPPGNLKPATNLTYDVQLQQVTTIPAYLKIPDQYWEDFVMFQSWIDARLLYGLSVSEENQMLNGDGTGSNLQGFMLVALTAPAAGAGSLLDNVAAAIGYLYGNGYVPTGIVLNPNDWGAALKAGTGGSYPLGPPAVILDPLNLWGIPVVLSKAMAAGKLLVGQFNPYSQIFDRDTAAVEVADQNEDDFLKNLDTVRAEERLALAIYQPAAFAKGAF
jgi:HK97 family phage major capsid protein